MGCTTSYTQKKSRQFTSQKVGQLQRKAKILIEQEKLKDAQRIADLLFEDCQWEEAAAVYKRIIERQPELDYQIDGLGCIDEQVGYYIKDVYGWYKDQKLKYRIKGTPYDALSLCLSKTDMYNWDSFIMRREWYEQMIQNYPQNYQLYYGLGNLLSNQAIHQDAIEAYMTTIELKANFVKPYVDIAFIYEFGIIQKNQSVHWAHRALAFQRNNQFAMFIVAKNENQSQLQKIQKLEQLSVMFPRYVRVANEVGMVWRNNEFESIKWFKRCIQHYPLYETAYNNIGCIYEEKGDYEKAMEWYFKACEIDCNYQDSHRNLANVFERLILSDQTILQKSRRYNLKKDEFCYQIGRSYYSKKKVQISIKWFLKALQLNKYNYKAYNALGLTYDSKDDNQMAIQNYIKCIKIKADYYMAYYNVGLSNSKNNDIQEATKWYMKAINVHPRYYKAYSNLGDICKERNQNEEAIRWYGKAIKHNQTYVLGWVNMGICYLNIKNYRVALHCFSRAQQIYSSSSGMKAQVQEPFFRENTYKFNVQGGNPIRNRPIDPSIKQNLKQLIGFVGIKLKGNARIEDQTIGEAADFIVDRLQQGQD